MTETALQAVPKSTAPKYIPIEDLIERAEANPKLSEAQIAKTFGITPQVFSRRLRQHGYARYRLKNYQKNKADIWDFYSSKILNSVTPRDIKKASLLQKMTAAGICDTKSQEAKGLMTVAPEKFVFNIVGPVQVNTDNRHITVNSSAKPVDNWEDHNG